MELMSRINLRIVVGIFLLFFMVSACQPQSNTLATSKTLTPDPIASLQVSVFPPTIPEHRIGIREVDGAAEFFDKETGEKFNPRGANYVFVPVGDRFSNLTLSVGIYDATRTREDFQKLADLGFNTVRVFIDSCSEGPGCITRLGTPSLNADYMDNMADMMEAARDAGIFILFTSNDLPDGGGYSEEANRGSGEIFAGYRNSYYLTEVAISATRRYWRDILTALIDRGAAFDAVLGWQLLNEQWMFEDQPPLSLSEGMVETTTGTYDMSDPQQKEQMVADGLVYYIDQMKEEILLHDPTALVTMGFFAPKIAAPGWYVDTMPLLERSSLDFFDFHTYPGSISFADFVEAFGMIGFIEKPIILGEYGAFRHIYGDLETAAQVISRWAAESCEYGFDGWLYWTYYPASPEVGDRTWGLTDEDGYLLQLYSPENQPDICAGLEIDNGNLAFMKPVSASRSLSEEPAENAVDGNPATQWGAGDGPLQSIRIDLRGSYLIREIRLLVAQFPEGVTTHRIEIQTGNDSEFFTVHDFNEVTRDNDWLVFSPDTPLEEVRLVQIVTTSSPSWVAWKEIQVFGDPMLP